MSSTRGKRFNQSHQTDFSEKLQKFSPIVITDSPTTLTSSQSSLTTNRFNNTSSPLNGLTDSLTFIQPKATEYTGRPPLLRIFSAPAPPSTSPSKLFSRFSATVPHHMDKMPEKTIGFLSPNEKHVKEPTPSPVSRSLRDSKDFPSPNFRQDEEDSNLIPSGDFSEEEEDEEKREYIVSNEEKEYQSRLQGDFSDDELIEEKEDITIEINLPLIKNPNPSVSDTHSDTHIVIKCLKLLFAIIAASVNANNSFFGTLRSSTLFLSFTPPKNLAELTKNGLGDVPTGITIFACLAAIAAELVNIIQIYDFGGKAMDNVRKLLPILEKLWRKESLTRKELGILVGITLSLGAAAGAAKLAYDPTAKSPEWYFRILWGITAAIAFFVMTLITRSVNTQTAIEKIDWFYANPDKTYALRLFQKLTPHYTPLAQSVVIPAEFKEQINTIKQNLEEIFKQYKIPPNNIEYTLVKFLLSQKCNKSPSYFNKLLSDLNIPSYLNFAFALTFALVGWLIYTDKLSSLFSDPSSDKIGHVFWEIFQNSFSTVFSIPHMLFFFGTSHVILEKIKTSFNLGTKKAFMTLGLIALVLPTCLGLLNIALDIELHKHTDYPMPKEGSTRGWVYAVFSLFDSLWANLSSVLTMITLADLLKELLQFLAQNPFHQVTLKIINEVLTVEEEKQKRAKNECKYIPPSLPKPEWKSNTSPVNEKKTMRTSGEPACLPPLKPLAETVAELKANITYITSVTKQGFFKTPVSNDHSLKQPLLEREENQPKRAGCLTRILARCGYGRL